MKVTGYKLREALRRWTMRREVASKQFNESLWAFDEDVNDDYLTPVAISNEFKKADEAVARLQEAQQKYNFSADVQLGNKKLSLTYAVKKVGGAGRLEKMWRSAATSTGRDKYSSRTNTRSANEVQSKRQISIQEAMKEADLAASQAAEIRAAIANANSSEIDIDVNPSLME